MLYKQLNTKTPNTMLGFLMHFIKQFKIGFLVLVLTAIGYAVLQTLFPYLIKTIIDLIYTSHANQVNLYSKIKHFFYILCVLWFLMQAMVNIQGLYIFKILPEFKSRIKEKLFYIILNYKHDFFVHYDSSSIGKKIDDIARSSERIVQLFIFNFISIIAFFLMSLIIMSYVSVSFALIMLTWYVLHFSTSYIFIKKAISYEANYSDAIIKSNSYIHDILSNILSVKIFQKIKFEFDHFLNLQKNEISNYKLTVMHFEKMKLLQSAFAIIYMILVLVLLLVSWHKSKITIGDFAMISMLSFSSINIIWQIFTQILTFSRELGTLKSGLTLITDEYRVVEEKFELINNIHSIKFKNVYFSYSDKNFILRNLSIFIKAREKIGIIGNSGIGKTTFIYLMLGIYKPTRGKISINGTNLEFVTPKNFYDQISFIHQDIKIFDRTILENIQYGNENATTAEIYYAAKISCCHSFIMEFPKKYKTLVGENGVTLSGGQRQRIALARMVLRNAPIIIMDEPSSALDSATENELCKNMNSFLKNKTVLIISHKSAFLHLVDKIYTLKDGELILNHKTEDGLVATPAY